MDSELQEQEILVLKSIFDDSLELVDENDDNDSIFKFYKIKIIINVKDNFKLAVKKDEETTTTTTATTTTTTTTTTSTTSTTTVEEETIKNECDLVEDIKYYSICSLPPITFQFNFPKDYPSISKPRFKISCSWLNIKQMDLIVEYLDNECWEVGENVIFKYLDWIKNSMMEYLNIQNELILTSEPVIFSEDSDCLNNSDINQDSEMEKERKQEELERKREQLSDTERLDLYWSSDRVRWEHNYDWISLLSTLPNLLSHNFNEYKIKFNYYQNSHECPICYLEYPPDEFTVLSCLHHLCNYCLESIIRINLNDGNVKAAVKCSEPNCKEQFDQSIIKKFTQDNPELYERYEYLLKQLNPHQTKCTNCEGWANIDNTTHSAYCFSCYHSICLACKKKFHPGLTCEGVATRRNLNNVVGYVDPEATRYCPKCSSLILKAGGCNKVICSMCNCKFCWICIRPISSYDHFKNNKRCVLFEIPPDTHEINLRTAAGPVTPKLQRITYSERTGVISCAKCRDKITQFDNNNYVFCYKCYKHVCFTCKAFITGTKHFMTSKCNQHGPPNS